MTGATRTRTVPVTMTGAALSRLLRPAHGGGPAALVERSMRVYRRVWMPILSGVFEPVFYLLSVGVGVGGLVGHVVLADGTALPYKVFVAPALLATAAVNGAIYDATFNIFFKLRYLKFYDGVLATPMSPRDVAVGEIAWTLIRGGLYAGFFLLVMVVMGLVGSWWAVLALPAATVVGFAFGAVGMAVTTFVASWQDLEWIQLALLPMFLFATTFFPLSTYPRPAQLVVECTPVFHANELVRDLAVGAPGPGTLGHLAYLVVMGAAGLLVASRRLERLLLT